jgi:hypothetical protein
MIVDTTLAPRCRLVVSSNPRLSATGQLDAYRNEARGADLSSPTDAFATGPPWPGVVT